MYIIRQNLGWVTTKSTDVTIGVKTFSITDLVKYYQGIHPYDSYHYRSSMYLCTVGLEEVLRAPVYNRQADVDKVFFEAVTHSCAKFLLDWAYNWQEVYRQLAASNLQFREIIIRKGEYPLTEKQYKMLYVEVIKMKTFFRILNMKGALRMILTFLEIVLSRCVVCIQTTPEVYPFALKDKPQAQLALPAESHAELRILKPGDRS
ncbi:hypothetical protein [Chitinophaga tropicalis]|uniref:Uncharacterized protein n=1 Tax=Chitinophaga tropicalis TaxID=2683588 RepID=A0A7K1U138_9BACT|nr:hypothetical protein [Chitinophaga tropicalis]MVT07715.1 hypothetical protein [Chitinophaga tropicalis]